MIIFHPSDENLDNEEIEYCFLFSYPCEKTYPCHPIHLTLSPGYYMFECWGAGSFNSATFLAGKGAYTSGFLKLNEERDFFVYIGSGTINQWERTYNGGGFNQRSGAGATDVRLVKGEWNDFQSLKSRIMVAGGGGGADGFEPGNAVGIGTESDPISKEKVGGNANQTSGGDGFLPGVFGQGGGYNGKDVDDGSGSGGGGYYGGGSSPLGSWGSGGGGSSFISGYRYCNAISNESSDINHIIHLNKSIHYSGLYFIKPIMIDGSSKMPSPNISGTTIIGNKGNGAFKITQLYSLQFLLCTTIKYNANYLIYLRNLFVLIILKK